MTNNEFIGGFSYRSDVVGKPPKECLQYLQLGANWKWVAGGQPVHLANCLTDKGFAVTPGRWRGGHKSKRHGTLQESNYILLDYDEGLSWEDAKNDGFFKKNAVFAYTSPSHQKPGKGDRYRVVFALDRPVTDSNTFDMVIQGLRTFCPAQDDASINAASLLYGNPNAELHIYDYENRLNVEQVYLPAAIAEAKRKLNKKRAFESIKTFDYTADNSIARVKRWLNCIPNKRRSTWVRVAGCLRNIEAQGHEWAYGVFEAWSANGYDLFEPDDCERLWDSLEPLAGGFGRLKQISQYFEAHPFEYEVDTHTLDEFINNELFNYELEGSNR